MKCPPDRIQPRIISRRRMGVPWEEIAESLGLTMEEVREHTFFILQRLGLKELTPETITELGRKLRKREPVDGPIYHSVTNRQEECLRLYARGFSYKEIALSLKLKNPQTVQNHISQACCMIGVIHAGKERLALVQAYFAKKNHKEQPEPPKDPMDDPCF